MTCPICRLENPPTADRCDCGHAFTVAGAAMPPHKDIPPPKQKINVAEIVKAVVVVAVAIWLYPRIFRSSPTPTPVHPGDVVSVAQPAVCAPSSEALSRIFDAAAIDEEEFLRATGREARRAGWEGPIFLGPPDDRVKVLRTTLSKALVRPLNRAKQIPGDEDGCWVHIAAIQTGIAR